MRAYKYKKRAWHYFLFDLCYYVTILNFVYIWILPRSASLWVACYCLSHGSLASAVITWRNSLVFHDSDKVTSLFVHVYPPLVFSVIRSVTRLSLASEYGDVDADAYLPSYRHFYPNASTRFPALAEVPHLDPKRAFLLSGIICKSRALVLFSVRALMISLKILSGKSCTGSSFWSTGRPRSSPGSARHPSHSSSMTNAALLVALSPPSPLSP